LIKGATKIVIETLTSTTSTPTANQPANQTVSPVAKNLFHYRNETGQIQIIWLDRSLPHRFEKVVFPGEQLLFYATSETVLNIHTQTATALTLIEQVSCSQLQVLEAG
jgi:hypothetical protein